MTRNIPNFYNAPGNMAEVIQIIERDTSLSENARRDIVFCIRRTATMLECHPRDLDANISSLRCKMMLIHPAMHGISAKTLSNIRSNVARGLVIAGIVPAGPKPNERSPAWVEFLGHAIAKHQVFALSRFVSYCMTHGVEPSDVDDTTMAGYRQHLENTLLTNLPKKVCNETVQTWNCVVKRAGLDFVRLSPVTCPQFRAKSLSRYLPGLKNDIEAYRDRLAHADIFDEEGPTKALRPASIRNIDAHLRQYLDAVTTSGYPAESFKELSDIVQPEIVKAGFGVIVERNGGEPPVGLKNIAGTLLGIARNHVRAPDDQIAFLKNIKSRLAVSGSDTEFGLSEKNVIRLQQFDDWHNVLRLIALPEELLIRAKDNPDSRRSALDVMYAVGIAILLACPMRVSNLASLDLARHITTRRLGSKTRYAIRIEGREVKNLSSIDVDLGAHASEILAVYLKGFRHAIADEPGTALFPQQSGGARDPGNFSQEITKRIYRETGLRVHGHLFRHLAAKLYLDRFPGDYETVRRLLGHKKLDTTMKFYARLSNRVAFKVYDTSVLSHFRGRKDD